MTETKRTARERIEQFARDLVWGRADHECGGLHAGVCRMCDEDVKHLSRKLSDLLTVLVGGSHVEERTLADYRPQHDEDCARRICTQCGHSDRVHETSHRHQFIPRGKCSCGLDALLLKENTHD